ncbi:vomeronasal type-1 receptor 2-like [Meriones unguiculatus]|uniref:vomeronasal type-1 receptor 2-like n=1 Tax=Meriones unguiculatus TaxID=10047 RepID=UPI00293F00C0|nr:vomeronasal type-1 receptor 2-like [Meriones unguiculatus]
MDFRTIAIVIILSLQSALGLLGNFSLLFYYLILYYNEHTLKIKDIILVHVFASNTLIILSRGVLQIMRAIALNQFFSDVGCKLIIYIYTLGRNMYITITCLLSVFQAITNSPRNLCCNEFKIKTTKVMGLSISLCWILYMLVNMTFTVCTPTKRNSKNKTQKRDFQFCHSPAHETTVDLLYVTLFIFPEVLFSLLIVCSSTFMIIILYGHKKRVQHILSTHTFRKTSRENRATKTILVMVCTFLAFYTLSSILQGYIALSHNSSWWKMSITSITSLCFPMLGPFVMYCEFTVSRFCFT